MSSIDAPVAASFYCVKAYYSPIYRLYIKYCIDERRVTNISSNEENLRHFDTQELGIPPKTFDPASFILSRYPLYHNYYTIILNNNKANILSRSLKFTDILKRKSQSILQRSYNSRAWRHGFSKLAEERITSSS